VTLSISWLVPALTLVAQQPAAPQLPALAPGVLADQIACAPMSPPAPPTSHLRVSGSYQHGRMMFATGDSFIVDAGAKEGLQRGQVFFVRRWVRDMFTPASPDFTPISIHTAGWVTILDTREETAVAQVTHACDAILDGDYLEPYTEPAVPTAIADGEPDFDHPARIVMGDQTLQTGSPGVMMLINRGSDQGVKAGQTLTIYRETLEGAAPSYDVGRGTILSVQAQTSLIRIDSSRGAVYVGDLAALAKIQ
jgi:hypothetical protein